MIRGRIVADANSIIITEAASWPMLIAFLAGFFLIGEAASWPMLFVAGYLLDRIML